MHHLIVNIQYYLYSVHVQFLLKFSYYSKYMYKRSLININAALWVKSDHPDVLMQSRIHLFLFFQSLSFIIQWAITGFIEKVEKVYG